MPIISETAKPFTGPGAELVQDRAGHDDGDVGVDDRRERPAESRVDGRPDGLPEPELLPDALEDEDVGVDRHADRQHDARRCRASVSVAWNQAIAARRMRRLSTRATSAIDAGQPVVDHHEQEHGGGAGERSRSTPLRIESAPSEGPTVRSSRTCTGAWSAPVRSTIARSLASSKVKPPGDLGLSGGNALADHGRGVDVAVEDDRELLAHALLGRLAEDAGADAVERHGDVRLAHVGDARPSRRR